MENSSRRIFRLYSNCIPVKGRVRSIICDLQNGRYRLIPNLLFDILEEHHGKSVKEIKATYPESREEVIDEYIDFLIEQNFGHFITESNLSRFPKFNLDWMSPSSITNAIIDISNESFYDVSNVILELEELGCQHIQLRFFDETDALMLRDVLCKLEGKNIISIEIIFKYTSVTNFEWASSLTSEFKKIKSLIIHGSPSDEVKYSEFNNNMGNILFIKDKISNSSHCGVVSPEYFRSTLPVFSESMKHNNCLNRKIGIDIDGNIKNCPSMRASFGRIGETKLAEVYKKSGFRRLWNINKDRISVCRECEFRYICTDCRAYVRDSEDQFSKPLKCGYDPNTGKWQEWSRNPLSKTNSSKPT